MSKLFINVLIDVIMVWHRIINHIITNRVYSHHVTAQAGIILPAKPFIAAVVKFFMLKNLEMTHLHRGEVHLYLCTVWSVIKL